MKKPSRLWIALLSVLAVCALAFAGCAKAPATLEEFINSNDDIKAQYEDLNSENLNVSIEGNTLTYTYFYEDTYSNEMLDLVKTEADSILEKQASTFETVSDTLERQSGIEGITVQVVYINGDGTEIIRKEF